MGKRHQTGGDVAGREAKRRGQKKQLYLALDDWDKGYSIHPHGRRRCRADGFCGA